MFLAERSNCIATFRFCRRMIIVFVEHKIYVYILTFLNTNEYFTWLDLLLTFPSLRRLSASRAKNTFTGSWATPPTGSGNSFSQHGHVTLAPCDCDVVCCSSNFSRQRRQNECMHGNIFGSVYSSLHSRHFVNLSLSPSAILVPFTSAFPSCHSSRPPEPQYVAPGP